MGFIQNLREFNLELVIAFILLIVLSFVQVNVNEQIGNIFSLMVMAFIVGSVIISISTNRSQTIAGNFVRRNNDYIKSIIIIGVAFISFSLIGNFVLGSSYAEPAVQGQSLFQFLADQAPILSADPIINFVMIGQIVPFVETMLFFGALVTLITVVALKEKEDIVPTVPKAIWVYGLITIIFVVFHFTSKFAQGITAFLITGLFAIVSIALALFTRQMFEAVMLHVLVNSSAMRGSLTALQN